MNPEKSYKGCGVVILALFILSVATNVWLIKLGQVEQPHDLFVARTFIIYSMTAGLQAEDFAAHRQHILTDREMYDRAKEWYR